MPSKRPSKGHGSAKVEELHALLAQEKQARAEDKSRLEEEIDQLKELVLQAQESETALDIELRKKVRRLERELQDAALRLSESNRKTASLLVRQGAKAARQSYNPFEDKGWLLYAMVLTGVLLALAVWVPFS